MYLCEEDGTELESVGSSPKSVDKNGLLGVQSWEQADVVIGCRSFWSWREWIDRLAGGGQQESFWRRGKFIIELGDINFGQLMGRKEIIYERAKNNCIDQLHLKARPCKKLAFGYQRAV